MENVAYDDNTPAVDLILRGKRSLFGMLDSTTKMAARRRDWLDHPELADRCGSDFFFF